MSDLTRFRDHCRVMAVKARTVAEDPIEYEARQTLWTQLADEIDAYLAGPVEAVDLFGDARLEPDTEVP